MQNFQSINFMEPYQKYSFEELRLADYNAGRQFGNGTGQPAGGFGSSSTFGGFGSNNTTGGFGSNNQTNNPFGSNTSTSGGFGANTSSTFGGASGGLFGQNKPATGGLFGQQSSSTTGGGLFGTSNNNTSSNPFSTNNTSTGFGSNNATSGGLFGNSNNNQSKPGGLFGNTGTSSTGGGFSFGSNNNQQQSSTTGGGLFGNNNQQQQSTGGGLFGNNNNSQQQNKPGGLFGNSTGGAFGSNTTGQTSGGLFGTSTNTNTSGGGLFGNNNASTTGTTGGLFGNSSNAASSNTGGGLFGNNSAANQSKPGGLFGNSTFGNNQQQSTGGGLFGNTQQQSSTGGGLFGNNNNNATSTGGFSFNNNQNKPAGGLFGTSSNNQSGGLFGNSTGGGNSLFANSMNQSQQAQQQQSDVKHASLLDSNPYGQSSIWTGLPAPTEQNSQPLVTALTATQKLKESQAKPPPNLRLNQSRYMTPPRRGGYGFSYSTYGTPSSAASTPGGNSLSTSMYGSRFTGGSFGRSMGKAASVSNMRSYYNEGESVLAPGAFTPSSSRYSSGSIRRLTIDRSIRDDLFSPRPALPAPTANSAQPTPSSTSRLSNGVTSPQVNDAAPENFGSKLKKRVSFDKDTTGGENGTLNSETGAMVPVEEDGSGASPSGTLSPAEPATNGLSTVPEDRESENVTAPRPVKDKNDPKPGEYWMRPSYEEIAKMPREQTSQFRGLQVGRQGCGFVTFDGAVDLKSLPPQDALFGPIINISVRSITVYPESSVKPPMGKGLNVPSTLTIENSWPRARGKPEALSSGPLFEKHLKRLKNIGNTKFVSYDVNTGVWVFKVDHYTTYGLDYDDEEDGFGTSQLSAPPDSIKAPDSSVMEVDSDHTSDFGEDDTFHGKQLLTVPGGFGKRSAIDSGDNSIVKSIEYDSPRSEHSNFSEDEASDNERPDMAGSYPDLPVTEAAPQLPHLQPGTPGRPLLDIDLEGDWAEQLQRTISPRKQDRNALREAQNKILLDREYSPIKPGTIGKKGFGTSIDIMHSLFDKRGGQMDSAGFEV
jgi:nuclear pore complex protein Nup98-Nup96